MLTLIILLLGSGGLSVGWDLDLLHVNDIHVRMEETNKYSAACRLADKDRGKCFGGVARLATAVKKEKESGKNILWLNAGDFYQGTVWYSHFKWRVVARFNSLLNFDAMTLGNHEFDDGVKGLVPFLRNQTVPFVVSNIDTSLTPDLDNLYQPSVVLEVGGRKVGVVGYLTPETLEVSNPGALIINDELEPVAKEVARLEAEGVDIIIGLGHSGYQRDMELAKKIPGLDVVVGGHTHSFLYSATPNPSNNVVEGPYPTIVKKSDGSGREAAVVQAFAYTKYLGKIRLTFDDSGHLTNWSGNPILLDKHVLEDAKVAEELRGWRSELDKIGKDLVGFTNVVLFNTREAESNIGNLVTDAMVWAYRESQEDVRLSLVNSGGIRASFDQGNITMEDLLMSFPFRNTFDIVSIRGHILRKVFEHSVASMGPEGRNEAGRFLQVGGFKLKFDLRRPRLQRLVLAEVPCDNCPLQYEPIKDDQLYKVVMTEYVAGGGDGFKIIAENKEKHLQGPLDTDILREYIKARSPLNYKVEERIAMRTTHGDQFSNSASSSFSSFFFSPASLTSNYFLSFQIQYYALNKFLC